MTDLAVPATELLDLPVDRVWPAADNVRHSIDDQVVADLAASIREVGLLEPLVVTRGTAGDRNGYEIVAGHHRHAAAVQAGLPTVPCVVRRFDGETERLLAMLAENLHRRELDPLEEGEAYARLAKLGVKQRDLADRVGRSQSHVSKRVSLTKLPEAARRALGERRITVAQAEDLTRIRSTKAVEGIVGGPTVQAWKIDEALRRQERQDREAKARKEIADLGLPEIPWAKAFDKHYIVDGDDATKPTAASIDYQGNVRLLAPIVASKGGAKLKGGPKQEAAASREPTPEMVAEARRRDTLREVEAAHAAHLSGVLSASRFDVKAAQRFIEAAVLVYGTQSVDEMLDPQAACTLLGLDVSPPDGLTATGGASLAAFAADGGVRATKATLALLLAASSAEALGDLRWCRPGDDRNDLHALHYGFLEATGYVVGDDERALLDELHGAGNGEEAEAS